MLHNQKKELKKALEGGGNYADRKLSMNPTDL